MNFYDFKPIYPDQSSRPYHSEKNVSGVSLNPGLLLGSNFFEVEYFAGLRYDIIHYNFGTDGSYTKDFLLDHNFTITMRKRNFGYGLGFSIINSRKGYYYSSFANGTNPQYHNIEFNTVNAIFNWKIWGSTYLEFQVLYMPFGYPYNRKDEFIMYGLRGFYRFNFYD